MDQNASQLFECFVNEIDNNFCDFVPLIKQHLTIVVHPEKSHVPHTKATKLILQLIASAVNDVGDVVLLNKPYIFRTVLLAKKYAVYDS